jgi:signal transduction histidine kinase
VDKVMTGGNLVHSLRPGSRQLRIVAAIEMEACEFERTGIKCLLTHNEDEDEMDLHPDVSIALFRIFQESLTNILKHAQATEVRILIQNNPKQTELVISDNGRGFSQEARQKPRSFGLRGIQERVSHFGGEVTFLSAPDQGTTVAVNVPHRASDDSAFAASTRLPQQPLF